MKKVPLGVENFVEANALFYVDKTRIIKEILDAGLGKTLLFTRPRRFGKSLTLSMMECFFTDNEDYRHLFEDKEIFRLDGAYRNYAHAYPVVRLNMKDVSAPTEEAMIEQALETISSLFRNNARVLDNEKLFPYEVERFRKLANRQAKGRYEYADAIRFLCELLHKKTGKKAIVLIDEYDTPLENAFQNGFYDEAIEFFKRLYSTTLKANDHVLFSVVTGVLQISKESIFSELNNLNVFNFTDLSFLPYFGFTKEEVALLCDHFHVAYDEEKLHRYYGGYGSKECEIYNPWSILSYIDAERFAPYWVNTGSNQTVYRLIASSPNSLESLNATLASRSACFRYSPSISYKDVTGDSNSLFSYLVQSGYLVATPPSMDGECHLYIPNEEIRIAFQTEIIARGAKQTSLSLAFSFKEALMKGEEEAIGRYLREYVLDSFSYFDLTKEKDYQIVIGTLLAAFFGDYVIKSEVNNPKGRCDLMMEPKEKGNIGVVIELKYYQGRLGEKRMMENAKAALNQIKEKEYHLELQRLGCKKILLYAFCFSQGHQAILHEAIED